MKKILTILTIALFTCTAVFAAVDFSGSVTAGAAINYNNAGSGAWSTTFYGDDGDDTHSGTLRLVAKDEDGLWSAAFQGTFDANAEQYGGTGKWGVDVSLDVAKAFELPVALQASTTYLDRYTTLRAYADRSGSHLDRIRTVNGTSHFALRFGYEDYVTVAASYNAYLNGSNVYTVSAMSEPISGIKVSAAFASGGEVKKWKATATTAESTMLVGGSADIDLGKLLDLDFSLGLAVTDRYQFEGSMNALAAVVYGGYEGINAYFEYGLLSGDAATIHVFELGADFKASVCDIKLWFGSDDLVDFVNSLYVGADIGTTHKGVGYHVAVEYAGIHNSTDFTEFGTNGLTITPYLTLSF